MTAADRNIRILLERSLHAKARCIRAPNPDIWALAKCPRSRPLQVLADCMQPTRPASCCSGFLSRAQPRQHPGPWRLRSSARRRNGKWRRQGPASIWVQNFSLISRAVANLIGHVVPCFPSTDHDTVLGQWLHGVGRQHQQRRAV